MGSSFETPNKRKAINVMTTDIVKRLGIHWLYAKSFGESIFELIKPETLNK